ncbi:MAG: hypothetical protein HYX25_02460 [Candidatus Solibacter usitatus]|nr:hypothetical protein [Candidatus Solibacter usitatus]
MDESFTFFQYIDHLRRRGRWIGLTCAIAAALALIGSLLLPKYYTASVRLMIDSPAGNDVRSAMAITPIYFESLKSYEAFASSEELFLKAVEHFHLREMLPGKSIEQLHRSVLSVRLVPNTRILEITCTLPNADTAHFLALSLAGQTLALSRGPSENTDLELVTQAEKRLEQARARMEQLYAQGEAKGGAAEAQQTSARENFEEAERRLGEVRAAAGYRGERLSIIDAGVVPEKPTWPNLPLNVAVAVFIGLLASVVWVTLEFSRSLHRP